MKIQNFSSKQTHDRARVSALITWEDCDRPAHELYFETTSDFAEDLTCNPDAFLTACIMPALRYGEKRVLVEGEVCPELRDNLTIAMSYMLHWYDWYKPGQRPVAIEAKLRSELPVMPQPGRAGWYFSGGIDSIATFQANRLNYPLDHPASIKDGLFIYGFDFGKSEKLDELDRYEELRKVLDYLAKDAGVTLIPVYTNIRQKFDSKDFWRYELSGAALSAVAHVFPHRLSVASLASGSDIAHLRPLAQHPLLEPNYSSYTLKIRHDSVHLSRLEKTALTADWDLALQNLRVCNHIERMKDGQLNCGQCEKCVRTMTALLALNKLKGLTIFPTTEVSESLIVNTVRLKSPYEEACYRDLIPAFEEMGRHDLVNAIKRIIARYHETDLQGRIKRLDRQFLGGSVTKLKQLSSFRR